MNTHIPISTEEPQATLDMAGKKIYFLVDTGAIYSVLNSYSGPFSYKSANIMGVKGNLKAYLYTFPVTCQFESQIFKHSVLIVPPCPSPLLGQDLLARMGIILLFPEELLELSKVMIIRYNQNQEEIPSSVLDAVNLLVWESGIPGRAKTALLVKIQLNPRWDYPHRRQYPIK